MTAGRAVEILDRLTRHGVTVWLDGGWGVDALLGRVTRPHDDLDVIVPLDRVPRLESALTELGYERLRGAPPTGFEAVDSRGHQVDVHPVTFAPNGEGIYKMESGEDWLYPATAFSGVGFILRRRVQCLTPEELMRSHTSGYALDEAHRRDVHKLSEQFGLTLPEFQVAD